MIFGISLGMDFTQELLDWHAEHQRALPWKETQDPYAIWVSEIILQQTRVEQGTAYYYRFLQAFPTVHHLAAAPIDHVLRLWQGLGYYARARHMHTAAQQIVARYNGIFPSTVEDLRTLSGIGPYTAAAIASFAFHQPVAALDGNGFRILARFFGIDTAPGSPKGNQLFGETAKALLPAGESARFNQALMDFGSLVCTPAPQCPQCPLQEACAALLTDQVDQLPTRLPKAAVRDRYFHYIDVLCDGCTFIGHRTTKDIWQGLYEFPLIETPRPMTWEEVMALPAFEALMEGSLYVYQGTYTRPAHKLSHQTIHASFHRLRLDQPSAPLSSQYLSIKQTDWPSYPTCRLIDGYLDIRR